MDNMTVDLKTSRVSYEQLETLLNYMDDHRELAIGYLRTTEAIHKSKLLWAQLTAQLNSCSGGAKKSVKGWSKYWSDYKNKLKTRIRSCSILSAAEERAKEILGPRFCSPVRTAPVKKTLPPQQTSEDGFMKPSFSLVMKCCVQLVREHGSLVEKVIEHSAFQQILALTSLTAEERGKITADNVRSMMEDGEEEHDCSELEDTGSGMGDKTNESDFPAPMAMKEEIEVSYWPCDEDPGDLDESEEYLDHYRISSDEATCTICDQTLTCKSVSALKDHLWTKHPEVTDIRDHEDDGELQRPTPSSNSSMKLTKYINLYKNDNPLAETPPANKKRKIEPDADNEPIATKHAASSLVRFKSVDHFGVYIASLLKLLPEKKCIKYQNQIVDRLLKDLAAAA